MYRTWTRMWLTQSDTKMDGEICHHSGVKRERLSFTFRPHLVTSSNSCPTYPLPLLLSLPNLRELRTRLHQHQLRNRALRQLFTPMWPQRTRSRNHSAEARQSEAVSWRWGASNIFSITLQRRGLSRRRSTYANLINPCVKPDDQIQVKREA
jgi:hypothetical protein